MSFIVQKQPSAFSSFQCNLPPAGLPKQTKKTAVLDTNNEANATQKNKGKQMGFFERLIKIFITFVVFIIAQGFLAGSINTFFDLIPFVKVDHFFSTDGNDDANSTQNKVLSAIESTDASSSTNHTAHSYSNTSKPDGTTTSATILSTPLYT